MLLAVREEHMARVKGTAIAGRLAFARRKGGEEAVTRLLAAISDPGEAEQLRLTGALKGSWYQFQTFIELSEALDRHFGKGDGALIPEMAGDVAENDLKTVYKIFFKLAAPQHILVRAATVWRQYYDSGELVVSEDRDGHARLELRGFESPHRTHCLAVQGWIQRTLRLTGARLAHVTHPRCRASGAPVCEFVSTWNP